MSGCTSSEQETWRVPKEAKNCSNSYQATIWGKFYRCLLSSFRLCSLDDYKSMHLHNFRPSVKTCIGCYFLPEGFSWLDAQYLNLKDILDSYGPWVNFHLVTNNHILSRLMHTIWIHFSSSLESTLFGLNSFQRSTSAQLATHLRIFSRWLSQSHWSGNSPAFFFFEFLQDKS